MPVNRPAQTGEPLEILSLVICRREFIAGTGAIHDELMPTPFPLACLDQTHLLLVRCIAIDHLLVNCRPSPWTCHAGDWESSLLDGVGIADISHQGPHRTDPRSTGTAHQKKASTLVRLMPFGRHRQMAGGTSADYISAVQQPPTPTASTLKPPPAPATPS